MNITAGVAALQKHSQDDPESIVRAIMKAVNEPEREPGYYWVRHDRGSGVPILFWNGKAWYHGGDVYLDDVTPISDKLEPPTEPVEQWHDATYRPDPVRVLIYVNADIGMPQLINQVDWSTVKSWRYATDWTIYDREKPDPVGRLDYIVLSGKIFRNSSFHYLDKSAKATIVAYRCANA